ncbi:hypothetical protein MVEN_00770900 [Mycena venus]|uniref:Vacuolar protein 8 n=1 Tax=Mycena venus TaxID=2733690 RepID=A0A8H6YM48_9AGAR|nr:hypothetical protein MVEN_00770900 [Mycena venus]
MFTAPVPSFPPPPSMNPLARQDSRPSFLSYWSDSNRGPTINLHAAAKPLMKLMYHRQTLEFIRKNRGSLLSRDVLDTYSSYFPWDYVSHGTKIAILSELTNRTESDVEARAVVDSPVFYHIAQMLRSPDTRLRSASCVLLVNLASHECIAPAILELDFCEQLVSLLAEDDSELTWAAQGALYNIAQRFEGAQAIVESPVLDHVLELLESPRWVVRSMGCGLVEKLAQHNSTLLAILKSKACVLLVPLLVDEHFKVAQSARTALSCITQRLEDAPAVDVNTLDYVLALLGSPNPEVKRWACDRVGGLARHESSLPTILESMACARVVSLLSDENPKVVHSARNATSCIAQRLEDAPAVDVKTLDHILALLESSNPETRRWACDRMEGFARRESILPAILGSRACERLISLLFKEHSGSDFSALSRIAQVWGVQAIVEAQVLDHILELLGSPRLEVRKWTCELLEIVARHDCTVAAILDSQAWVRLINLLNDNSEKLGAARRTLTAIAQNSEGAPAIAAKLLDRISELQWSSSPELRGWTCDLLAGLARHGPTLPLILESKACVQLATLLSDEHPEVVRSTSCALSFIAESTEGAQAMVEVPVLGRVLELLESPTAEVQIWTCDLIERLAHHESAVPAILKSKACGLLLSMLRHDRSKVVRAAAKTLSFLAERLEGAQAIVDAKALDGVLDLLEASSPTVQRWTCVLVENLARHDFAVAILEPEGCGLLVLSSPSLSVLHTPLN